MRTSDEFFKLVDADQLGHVGLAESAALCALGVGLDCDDFEEEIIPVIAEEDITGGAFVVKKGKVAGTIEWTGHVCEEKNQAMFLTAVKSKQTRASVSKLMLTVLTLVCIWQ